MRLSLSTVNPLEGCQFLLASFHSKKGGQIQLTSLPKSVVKSNTCSAIFLSEWFEKGVLSINDLLSESGNILTFHEFRDKYSCKSNFLQYYQVVSAIPKRLWSLAKGSDTINKSFFTRNDNIFSLNESTQINLYKA